MVKLVKLNVEERIRNHLRSKYMDRVDRMTEDRDWKDGINQFRLRALQDIQEIHKQLELIQEKLNIFVDGDQIV